MKVANTKGKGYIGRSMSVNAKKAHESGVKPISYFSANELKSLGFNYPFAFFKWMVDKQYITHKEMHHTSASMKYTKFYGPDTVKFVVKNYNLDLLYKIYQNKITKEEAKYERGMTYVRVKTLDSVFEVNKGNVLTINCIKCDDIIWYSNKVCFYLISGRSEILEEYQIRPAQNFENKYLSKVSDMLLKRKTNCFVYMIR